MGGFFIEDQQMTRTHASEPPIEATSHIPSFLLKLKSRHPLRPPICDVINNYSPSETNGLPLRTK
jgi:hypothetical protein